MIELVEVKGTYDDPDFIETEDDIQDEDEYFDDVDDDTVNFYYQLGPNPYEDLDRDVYNERYGDGFGRNCRY